MLSTRLAGSHFGLIDFLVCDAERKCDDGCDFHSRLFQDLTSHRDVRWKNANSRHSVFDRLGAKAANIGCGPDRTQESVIDMPAEVRFHLKHEYREDCDTAAHSPDRSRRRTCWVS